MENLKNYINGSWVESTEQGTTNVVNPANQEVLARVPFGKKTGNDANVAVDAAGMLWKSGEMCP
jgi:malonate-semialdehyde dehydrogenase (acetylating)/methylmalonate-semialdehyde dehydrogenase